MNGAVETPQRRLRRAKDSERRCGKWFIEHDGPDPHLRPGGGIVTSTGRVGHITALQFDVLSRSYAVENKNIKVWAGLWDFWVKVVGAAIDQGKEPAIRIEPTNESPTQVKGRPIPNLHIISEKRHEELLRIEHEYYEAIAKRGQAIQRSSDYGRPLGGSSSPYGISGPVRSREKTNTIRSYSKEQQLGGGPKRRRG